MGDARQGGKRGSCMHACTCTRRFGDMDTADLWVAKEFSGRSAGTMQTFGRSGERSGEQLGLRRARKSTRKCKETQCTRETR